MDNLPAFDRQAATLDLVVVARRIRSVGLAILSFGVATSTLTFNWIISHDARANFFPEFAGRVVYLSDLVLLAGIAVWLAGWHLFPRRPLRFGPAYVFVPLAVLVILTVFSVGWASDPGLAGFATARRLLLFAMYGVLVTDFKRAQMPMIAALFLFGLLHTAVSWGQVVEGAPLGLAWLGELPGPDGPSGLIGCPRPIGLGFHCNPLAMFLGVVAASACGIFLLADPRSSIRWPILVVFEVVFLGLVSNMTRAAALGCYLGLGGVSLAACYWNRHELARTLKRGAIAAVLVVLTLEFYPVVLPVPLNCTRPSRYSKESLSAMAWGRMDDFRLAMPIIADHFWLGIGASNFPLELKKRLSPGAVGPSITPVHNVALLLWAELGIAGASCWLLIMAAPVIWAWSRARVARVELHELMWLGPLLVLFFISLAEFSPWATQDGRVLMMALLAMWAGGVNRPSHQSIE